MLAKDHIIILYIEYQIGNVRTYSMTFYTGCYIDHKYSGTVIQSTGEGKGCGNVVEEMGG